jgi:hypothetical protein
MKPVSKITNLSSPVQGLQASTIDSAIRKAEDWAKSHGVELAGQYFLQVKLGKSESIIVDIKPSQEL